MRHRKPEQPGRLARLLGILRKRSERPVETLGPATCYPARAGAWVSVEHARRQPQHQEADQTVILDRPLFTRAGAWRASHALRNGGANYR